jgi:hypothetical protein
MISNWLLKRRFRRSSLSANYPLLTQEEWESLAIMRELATDFSLCTVQSICMRQYLSVQDQTDDTRRAVLATAASMAVPLPGDTFRAIQMAGKEIGLPIREIDADVFDSCCVAKLDRTWYILGDTESIEKEGVGVGVSVQAVAQQLAADGMEVVLLAQKQPKRVLGIFACGYVLPIAQSEWVTELSDIGVTLCVDVPATTQSLAMAEQFAVRIHDATGLARVQGNPFTLHMPGGRAVPLQQLKDVAALIVLARRIAGRGVRRQRP